MGIGHHYPLGIGVVHKRQHKQDADEAHHVKVATIFMMHDLFIHVEPRLGFGGGVVYGQRIAYGGNVFMLRLKDCKAYRYTQIRFKSYRFFHSVLK